MWPNGPPQDEDWWREGSASFASSSVVITNNSSSDSDSEDERSAYTLISVVQQTMQQTVSSAASLFNGMTATTPVSQKKPIALSHKKTDTICRPAIDSTSSSSNSDSGIIEKQISTSEATGATRFRNCGYETWELGRAAWKRRRSEDDPIVPHEKEAIALSSQFLRGVRPSNPAGPRRLSKRAQRQITTAIEQRMEIKLAKPIPLSGLVECYAKVWNGDEDSVLAH
jgi:hypothetical protein